MLSLQIRSRSEEISTIDDVDLKGEYATNEGIWNQAFQTLTHTVGEIALMGFVFSKIDEFSDS